MNFGIYLSIIILSIFLDKAYLYYDYTLSSVILFINLLGLYILFTKIQIDINIRYGNREQ